MKRTIITVIALACVAVSPAQGKSEFEKAVSVRDSVAKQLSKHRVEYAKDEKARERLKPVILGLEEELARVQAEYEKALQAVSKNDMSEELKAYDKACKDRAAAMKAKRDSLEKLSKLPPTQSKVQQRRNLIDNGCFVKLLPENDYVMLRAAQNKETQIKSLVESYMQKYSELQTLQHKYMEVVTKEEADQTARQFADKERELEALDKEISSIWSSVYYNKVYAYDLLMERSRNEVMLDHSAAILERANREVDSNTGIYQSDGLVAYCVRKRALTEYEMKIASSLQLPLSSDSLKVVASELKNCDLRVSKLALQHRNFIKYEPIGVKKPSIYNAKNPIPRTKVYESGAIYRIRVGYYLKKPSISAMKDVYPISFSDQTHSGYYAYYVGGFPTEKEAKEGVAKLKKIGFKEPIISVWVDGIYYPTVEEMRLSAKLYSLEISGISALTNEMKAKVAGKEVVRVGSTLVVGKFEDRAQADAVAASLQALNGKITIEVIKNH